MTSFRDQIATVVDGLRDCTEHAAFSNANCPRCVALDTLARWESGVWLSREEALSIASALNTNPAWWDMANTLLARLSEADGQSV